MSTTFSRIRAVALLATLSASPAIASDASEVLLNVPLPREASVEIVALDMRQNGALMSISTFRSDDTVEKTLEFYRSIWADRDERRGHAENSAGPWSVISRLEDNVNLVLQIQHGRSGGSEGLFSAVQLDDIVPVSDDIDLPPGAELVSATVNEDLGRTSNTWIIRSVASTSQVAAYYRDVLERKGWSLVSNRSDTGPHVLRFNHRGGSIELVVSQSDDGSTLGVLNQVDRHDS